MVQFFLLLWFYTALVLKQNDVVPDVDAQAARLDNLVVEFKDTFELSPHPTTVTKRDSKTGEYAGSAKRHKNDMTIEDAIEAKKVSIYFVTILMFIASGFDISYMHP